MKQWTAECTWQCQGWSSGSRESWWAGWASLLSHTVQAGMCKRGEDHLPLALCKQPARACLSTAEMERVKASGENSCQRDKWDQTQLCITTGNYGYLETSGNRLCCLWLCLLPTSKSIAIKKHSSLLGMSFGITPPVTSLSKHGTTWMSNRLMFDTYVAALENHPGPSQTHSLGPSLRGRDLIR